MPIQIISDDKSREGLIDDPRRVTQTGFYQGITDFNNNYKATGGTPIGQTDIKVLWSKLKAHVDSFMVSNGLTNDEVGMEFIHCLQNDSEYYMVLRLCQFGPFVNNETTVVAGTPEAWFQLDANITDGIQSLSETDQIVIDIINNNYCDPTYESGIYYHQSGAGVCINTDATQAVYVRSLMLPWSSEIKSMYYHNESPLITITHIGFSVYTQDLSGQANRSNVDWPHGMVAYTVKNGSTAMLNDTDYISVFANKAADYASLCPPNCRKYSKPS